MFKIPDLICTSLLLACELLCFGISISCQAQPSTEHKDEFYDLGAKKAARLGPIIPLRPGGPLRTLEAESPKTFNGVLRKYVNASLNSRLPITPARTEYREIWKASIPSSFPAIAVLNTGDRLLLQTEGLWLLYDVSGQKLAQGELGSSGLMILEKSFFGADSNGIIWSRDLASGNNIFGVTLHFGSTFERTFMHSDGRFLTVVSSEREVDPHENENRARSLIEVIDLGTSPKADRNNMLSSGSKVQTLARETEDLLAAADVQGFVLAATNRIYRLNGRFDFDQVLSGAFEPVALSVDGTSRAYSIVRSEQGTRLWRINRAGELEFDLALTDEFTAATVPPIIGFDHQIVIYAGNSIQAFSNRGLPLWSTNLPSEIAGAVITRDHEVILSSGSEVISISSTGRRRTLVTLPGERILTAPSFTSDGDLFIATNSNLYRFGAVAK